MLTKNGVRLIEYNARFGDPEVMNVLSVLRTDLVEIVEAVLKGRLHCVALDLEKKATVCKYVVPQGYPDDPVRDQKIEINRLPSDAKAYFASVDQREDGLYLVGSRAVAFVAKAGSLAEAEKLAEQAACSVTGPVFHRKDIGTAKLIEAKVKMMMDLQARVQPILRSRWT